tara:strand:- start:4106 stop:4657 length:552 start_codon:yes stop_codon:yes gene_type:complete
MMVEDNFLDNYQEFRSHCDRLKFHGEICPIDGQTYPAISSQIPPEVLNEIYFKIELVMGCEIDPKFIFMRLTTEGEYCPHQAHNDLSMAQWTFLLYLNKNEHCQGGTDFVKHIHGRDVEDWATDHSDPEKWEIVENCEMRENRACIFEAGKMHRAQPLGGFGQNEEDGRLVLICFFNADPISH